MSSAGSPRGWRQPILRSFPVRGTIALAIDQRVQMHSWSPHLAKDDLGRPGHFLHIPALALVPRQERATRAFGIFTAEEIDPVFAWIRRHGRVWSGSSGRVAPRTNLNRDSVSDEDADAGHHIYGEHPFGPKPVGPQLSKKRKAECIHQEHHRQAAGDDLPDEARERRLGHNQVCSEAGHQRDLEHKHWSKPDTLNRVLRAKSAAGCPTQKCRSIAVRKGVRLSEAVPCRSHLRVKPVSGRQYQRAPEALSGQTSGIANPASRRYPTLAIAAGKAL